MADLSAEKCVPCREGAEPLRKEDLDILRAEFPAWNVQDEDSVPKLERVFQMPDYQTGLEFTNKLAEVAEDQGHHPVITLEYSKVTVKWWTHAIDNLHRNDAIMTVKTDRLYDDLMGIDDTPDPVDEASRESFPSSDPPAY